MTGIEPEPEPRPFDTTDPGLEGAGFLQELFPQGNDAARCLGSLARLRRHIKEPVAITGSLAAGWHLLKRGIRTRKRLNDIDLVVEGIGSLNSSLSSEFLIRHFHPTRGLGRILIMLVDQRHRNRIDVFAPAPGNLFDRTILSEIGGMPWRIVSVEDLLSRLLSVICGAASGRAVDPKYVGQFRLLSDIADLKLAADVWCEHSKANQPLHFEQAADLVLQSVEANSALLQTTAYSQDVEPDCEHCHETEQFPLAPRSSIYEILGYV